MKILISNDDGIDSAGIQELAKAVASLGDFYVVAPHRERSTAGHALTLHKPLHMHDRGNQQYAASGTPADCIYLGIWELLKGKPDLILSGINNGANLGTDVHYSGTVAAAREGALMNVPSYAFSLVPATSDLKASPKVPMKFDVAARVARRVLEMTQGIAFPPHTLINVNIPNLEWSDIKGVKVARQGIRHYATEVTKRVDPRGRNYYWVGGPYVGFERGEDTDCHAVEEGWVSVTPLTIETTHNEFYTALRGRAELREKL